MSLFQSLTADGRILAKAEKLARRIESYDETYRALSDQQLREKTAQFRQRLSQGETLDDLLPEAFATAREGNGRIRCS